MLLRTPTCWTDRVIRLPCLVILPHDNGSCPAAPATEAGAGVLVVRLVQLLRIGIKHGEQAKGGLPWGVGHVRDEQASSREWHALHVRVEQGPKPHKPHFAGQSFDAS